METAVKPSTVGLDRKPVVDLAQQKQQQKIEDFEFDEELPSLDQLMDQGQDNWKLAENLGSPLKGAHLPSLLIFRRFSDAR